MKAAFLSLIALLLCACASQPAADMQTTLSTITGQPAAGFGRVYVFPGSVFVGSTPEPYLNSFDVLVDGILVGGVNNGEVMAIDLRAGNHIIVRKIKTIWGVSDDPISLVMNIAPSEKRYVAADRYMSGVEMTSFSMLLVRGRVAGMSAGMQTVSPERAPGDYLEERSDGPGIVASSKVVLPDRQAVAVLTSAN